MIKRIGLLLFVALCAVACIHVVVNVYFPEAEAKGALTTLEDELLNPPAPKAPEGQQAPSPDPQTPKPQSLLLQWFRPTALYAAGPVTEEQIVAQIRSMPEVMDAYRRMAARIGRVNGLRDGGLVGEGKDGLLSPRAPLADRKDQRTVEDENADRRIVIRGLARASVAAQAQDASGEAVDQVLPDSAATFAALRRDKAHPGWWIQLPDGTWAKKS